MLTGISLPSVLSMKSLLFLFNPYGLTDNIAVNGGSALTKTSSRLKIGRGGNFEHAKVQKNMHDMCMMISSCLLKRRNADLEDKMSEKILEAMKESGKCCEKESGK